MILDGKLFESDRCSQRRPGDNGVDLWCSGHKRRHGANIRFIAGADGEPLWTGDSEPGSVSDVTAARLYVPPLLREAAKQGPIILADQGHEGAGTGVHIPVKRPGTWIPSASAPTTRPPTCCYALCEASGSARWPCRPDAGGLCVASPRAPSKIGGLTKAALVLRKLEKQTR
ncbi:hypothetical protein J0910_01280 [Nocardiopsis sp. CNT-189]|uniref:hypothetical protein n=1 Tax=Nocardiopsis oceanisediminis TaxID=2816862 RepID=UPI003B2D2F3C